MSAVVPAEQIENIVGAPRDRQRHLARAVSAEQTVYILHSHRCKDSTPDLRECPLSLALDVGIDEDRWSAALDRVTQVAVRDGRLVPVRPVELR